MNNSELIECIIKAVPYPDQIKAIDQTEEGAARFTWRGDTFRVSKSGMVETVDGSCLVGDNKSLLMERLIQLKSSEFPK